MFAKRKTDSQTQRTEKPISHVKKEMPLEDQNFEKQLRFPIWHQ
jgi:hypothetical protein